MYSVSLTFPSTLTFLKINFPSQSSTHLIAQRCYLNQTVNDNQYFTWKLQTSLFIVIIIHGVTDEIRFANREIRALTPPNEMHSSTLFVFDHIAFIIFQKSQKVESETNERMQTVHNWNNIQKCGESHRSSYRRNYCTINRSFQFFSTFFFFFNLVFRYNQLLENTTGMFFQL